jgi:surface polysaccharide O-acyltransferase-like enzyme
MYAGIKAYRNHWLDNIPTTLARIWKRIGIAVIPVFPIGLILTGALNGHMTFAGGLNFQALLYALWEPFVCFGISIGLIVYFQRRWNVTNQLLKVLSDTAYTVYIIHPPIVVGWTMLFHQVHLPEFVKLIIVAPINVLSCVLVSYFICKIPYAKKVL